MSTFRRCDGCGVDNTSYKHPHGWDMQPQYEKTKGKRTMVDMRHLCPDCRKTKRFNGNGGVVEVRRKAG